jgi:hypothetical protein
MSAKGWPWDVLDLPRAPETTADVRRAYAKRLKTIDQGKDIAGFEALRSAYEAALQRVEQKARKAKSKTVAEPAEPSDLGAVEVAPDLAPSLPDRSSATEDPRAGSAQPDDLPGPPPIQSPEDRLRIRLGLLSEKNILLSPNAQVQAILDEPAFQSPELDQMIRQGLAQYIRSQLLWNHLNEPYLRHPGVTADLLKALDARFGWLSDYSAFRRDFWGDTHILEAMVDAAEIDRTPAPLPPTVSTGWRGWIERAIPHSWMVALAYFLLLRKALEAREKAQPDSWVHGAADFLLTIGVLGLVGFIVAMARILTKDTRYEVLGALGSTAAGVGLMVLVFQSGVIRTVPGPEDAVRPLAIVAAILLFLWLFHWLLTQLGSLFKRLRNRN